MAQTVSISDNPSYTANTNAVLDLDASSGTKGLLAPRMTIAERDNFDNSLGVADQGMTIYNTDDDMYEYWDGTVWITLGTSVDTQNTLDEAYDEGGAGLGRIIDADAGALEIQSDGILVSGTHGSGAAIGITGAGTRMFFNPKKSAFRAGTVDAGQWTEAFVGNYSFATGRNTRASGTYSVAMGYACIASGVGSIAIGNASATGHDAVAIGNNSEASASNAVVLGANSRAYATHSKSFASGGWAKSYGETVLGLHSTNYTANSTGSFDADDRLLTVGNGPTSFAPSDALVILKNGNTGIGTSTPSATLDVEGTFQLVDGNEAAGKVLTSDGSGNATWQVNTSNGLVDADGDTKIQVEESADDDIIRFDMAGTEFFRMDGGRMEVLNTGRSVFIGEGAGQNDDLSSNENVFIGFDAGNLSVNTVYNTAVGSHALERTTGGQNTAIGALALDRNTSGFSNSAHGYGSLGNNISGDRNTAIGVNAIRNASYNNNNTAIGYNALQNSSPGSNLLMLGVYSDVSTGTTNLSNATAIGYNAKVATSNSLVLGATGADQVNVGIGTASPSATLDVEGTFQLVDGNEAFGKVLTSDVNGNATWQVPLADTDTQNTLDQAYDEGGAGAGRTIDASDGAVRIDGEDGLIVTGALNFGQEIEETGTGTRMFFNPKEAAFRAGYVYGENWDPDSIGRFSIGMGHSAKATNWHSVSLGAGNNVTGFAAFSAGSSNAASASSSIALGSSNVSSGIGSAAIGSENTTSGYTSFAGGRSNAASGDYSTAMGRENQASGEYSSATGWDNIASGTSSVAVGFRNESSGDYSFSSGYSNEASGNYSFSHGYTTTASGDYSIAMGRISTASGVGAISLGYVSSASGSYALAYGSSTVASGARSLAGGSGTTASGDYSTVFGTGGVAASHSEFVVGRNNSLYTPIGVNSWASSDRVFVVGNGLSTSNRSDAFVILKNGNTGIGTSTPTATLDVEGTFQLVDGNEAAGKVLTSDANGYAAWLTPTPDTDTQNTLDQAYNEGGAGMGRTITASAGAVNIAGPDGLTVNGNVGIGTTSPSATLDVEGTFQLLDGNEAAGKVLTSDGSGNASWQVNSHNEIVDADGDTKIQLEESADEDIIRFDMAGTEHFVMDNGRLHVLNTGNSVFLGESAGENDDLSLNYNAFIGFRAGRANTSGLHNTALGAFALQSANTGQNNTAVGTSSLNSNTGGSYNSSVGVGALYSNTTGASNTALGNGSLYTNATGNTNTAIGNNAVYSNLSGTENTAIGASSLYNNTSGNYNVAIGNGSLNSNTTGSRNTAIGYQADVQGSNLTNATAIGSQAVVAASNSIALGGTGAFATNVGISTTTPANKLHVNGGGITIKQGLQVNDNATNFDAGIAFENYNTGHAYYMGYRVGGTFAIGYYDNTASYTTLMRLNGSGSVSIGTANTDGKLTVYGSNNKNFAARYYASNGTNGWTTANRALSAYFQNHIACEELQVFSDARIKNSKGRSDSKKDLETLLNIEITDYTFIDSVSNTSTEKKVIAQQVEEHYPLAVSSGKGFVPDIYKLVKVVSINSGLVKLIFDDAHNLTKSDTIRLIDLEQGQIDIGIAKAPSANELILSTTISNTDQVFVYGKQVNDFRTVDYDAISMLNVSATQELNKRLINLEKENAELRSKLESIESLVQQLKTDELHGTASK